MLNNKTIKLTKEEADILISKIDTIDKAIDELMSRLMPQKVVRVAMDMRENMSELRALKASLN